MKKLKQMYRCMEKLKYGNGKTTGCPTVLLHVPLGHDRLGGFTLVELVIVIAIVIILSVVSVPIYRNYVDRAKWSEAYALMGTIISAQKAYYSEYGNFLSVKSYRSNPNYSPYDPVLGIDARSNKYFSSFSVSHILGQENVKNEFWAYVRVPLDLSPSPDLRVLRYIFSITERAGDYPGAYAPGYKLVS